MSGRLSANKRRLSYAEELEKSMQLRELARQKGIPLTTVIKEATKMYIAVHCAKLQEPAVCPAVQG